MRILLIENDHPTSTYIRKGLMAESFTVDVATSGHQGLQYALSNDCDLLLDWIACVTVLDEPCAAIYLAGMPGVGKTLLADALARLYTLVGPTPLADVVGPFNDKLLYCPIVLADEVLPDALKRIG